MVFTLNETTVYIIVTVLLVLVQLYQQKLIKDLQKETRRLWEHTTSATILMFSKLEQVEKQLKDIK